MPAAAGIRAISNEQVISHPVRPRIRIVVGAGTE